MSLPICQINHVTCAICEPQNQKRQNSNSCMSATVSMIPPCDRDFRIGLRFMFTFLVSVKCKTNKPVCIAYLLWAYQTTTYFILFYIIMPQLVLIDRRMKLANSQLLVVVSMNVPMPVPALALETYCNHLQNV